jgi:hypothetical protein
MTDDFRDTTTDENGQDNEVAADTQKISNDYKSLYTKMIDLERMSLRRATREFLSQKELAKANNAGVSFILTRGIDELVTFLEHKLKSGDLASLIFVYQRLKFYCLDGLRSLGNNLDSLIQHLRTDEYYSDKKIVDYWKMRRRRVDSYQKGVEKIAKSLKLLFERMAIPDPLTEIETETSDEQLANTLAALVQNSATPIPSSLADLFRLK